MGVPVVSSDVGGQKELITKDVGKIVKVCKMRVIYILKIINKKKLMILLLLLMKF